jgi:nucleoside 2-deoxyribosyltransferase
MKKVYLAGPISGCSYKESNSWRDFAADYLAKRRITAFSPMRFKEHLKGLKSISDCGRDQLTSQRGLVARDKYDVKSSDLILFNLLGAKKVSIGSVIEYGWAAAFDKLVVTVMEPKGNPHEHSFIRELSDFRVSTLEEGLKLVVWCLNNK